MGAVAAFGYNPAIKRDGGSWTDIVGKERDDLLRNWKVEGRPTGPCGQSSPGPGWTKTATPITNLVPIRNCHSTWVVEFSRCEARDAVIDDEHVSGCNG